MLTRQADKKHHRLEKEVISKATRVIVVGNTMQQEFRDAFHRNIDVITNGFDEDDTVQKELTPSPKFSIAHVGTIVRTRNPKLVWNALSDLIVEIPGFAADLEIRLTGKVDIEIRNSLRDANLESYVRFIDYLPHDEVASEQHNASLLLLILAMTS